jgi:hypothetical protein
MSKPIIDPIYAEWWAKGPIVAASKQHEEDIKLGFYVGWFASMGLTAKLNHMDGIIAKKMAEQMLNECKKVLYNRTITPKVVAHINGEKI